MLYTIIAAVLVLLIIVIVVVKKKKDAPLSVEEELNSTIVESPKNAKEFPACNYPQFDHARLLTMGLEDEEAQEFVQELIPEIETNISSIKEMIAMKKHTELERIVHGIKGASNNVGTGGVSELLTEFHHYLRTNEGNIDEEHLEHYFKHLLEYSQALKKQYS